MKSQHHCQCIPAPLLRAIFLCCAADVWLLLGSGKDEACAAGAMTHSGTDELIRAEMKHFPASTFPCLQPSSLCSAASANSREWAEPSTRSGVSLTSPTTQLECGT